MPRLVTVDTARAWLRVSEEQAGDDLLALALGSAEALIESAVGRDLALWSGTERVDGTGTDTLYLTLAPVVAITNIAFTGAAGVPLSQITSWDDLAATASVPGPDDLEADNGSLVRLDGGLWPRGRRNIAVTYEAGFTPETLPGDLRLLVLQATGHALNIRGLGGTLKSESLGDLSRTYAEPSEADLYGIPGAAATIARYRRLAA
jgi:hypothetical protein